MYFQKIRCLLYFINLPKFLFTVNCSIIFYSNLIGISWQNIKIQSGTKIYYLSLLYQALSFITFAYKIFLGIDLADICFSIDTICVSPWRKLTAQLFSAKVAVDPIFLLWLPKLNRINLSKVFLIHSRVRQFLIRFQVPSIKPTQG